MRDLGTKMAELKFEAPLAKFEETDDWGGCDFISNPNALTDTLNLNLNLKDTGNVADKHNVKLRMLEEAVRSAHVSKNGSVYLGTSSGSNTAIDNNPINRAISPNCNTFLTNGNATVTAINDMLSCGNIGVGTAAHAGSVDNFIETFGGSLEDLVHTFDEKITKCFGNYEENIEELAPVQVRRQEEIMSECQMWWTITGNFGNILPIDWSKSYTRQMQMPALSLIGNHNQPLQETQRGGQQHQREQEQHDKDKQQQNRGQQQRERGVDYSGDLTSEDEAVANDLDMHALILNGLHNDNDMPIKSVEEVIKEIDEIIDEAESEEMVEANTSDSEVIEKAREVLGAPLRAEKLQYLTNAQLNELYIEMELLVQELSETLIHELALREELEFEKELKNSFISLLLAVQNKRRQYHVEKKRGKLQGPEPKYLTTVIPHHLDNGTPNNQALQVLIKILKAINEDSPTVPALLTDYILKVLCPT